MCIRDSKNALHHKSKNQIYLWYGLKIQNIFHNLAQKKNDLDLRKELIKIDSMSTYAIGYLINRICKNLSKNQVYLNIGCWKGFSLVAGMINTQCKVIGVDNFSQFTGPKNDFFKNFENLKKNNHFFFLILQMIFTMRLNF